MTFKVACAPVLKEWNCLCCSCSMRAATTVLAWLNMISVVVDVLIKIGWLAQLGNIDASTFNNLHVETKSSDIDGFDSFSSSSKYNQNQAFLNLSISALRQSVIVLLVLSLGNIIILALLLHGIHKKKPSFMLPYIFLQFVFLIIAFLCYVIGTIVALVYVWQLGLTILFVGGFVFAIIYFLWVVFYSYYRQLEDSMDIDSPHEFVNHDHSRVDNIKLNHTADQSPPPYVFQTKGNEVI